MITKDDKNSSWNIIDYTRFTREVIGIYWGVIGIYWGVIGIYWKLTRFAREVNGQMLFLLRFFDNVLLRRKAYVR